MPPVYPIVGRRRNGFCSSDGLTKREWNSPWGSTTFPTARPQQQLQADVQRIRARLVRGIPPTLACCKSPIDTRCTEGELARLELNRHFRNKYVSELQSYLWYRLLFLRIHMDSNFGIFDRCIGIRPNNSCGVLGPRHDWSSAT